MKKKGPVMTPVFPRVEGKHDGERNGTRNILYIRIIINYNNAVLPYGRNLRVYVSMSV